MARPYLARTLGCLLAIGLMANVPAVHAGPGGSPADGSVPVTLAAELRAVLDRAVDRRPLAGLSATVILPDGRTWSGGAGLADVATERPMRAWTSSVVGSITKTFVAATILQLAEEGRFGLDDALATWLPDYPGATQLTLRMLLSHTSGLHDYFRAPAYESLVFGRPRHHWTTAEILQLVQEPYFAPGMGYAYSNTNYILLGEVIRLVTGTDPAAAIRDRFVEPLGLERTLIQGHEPIMRIGARGYLWTGSAWRGLADGTRFRPNTSAATVADMAGAALSTAPDIARWGRALLGGAVLSPESMSQMLTVSSFEDYGLGVRRYELADGRVAWGHGGSLRGYVSLVWHLPDEGLTVALLTNRGRVKLGPLAEALVTKALRSLDE